MVTRRPVSLALALAALLAMTVAGRADGPVGVWVPGPSMADARDGHTAATLKDGRVLVVGVRAEVYDPASNRWSPAGAPAIATINKTATLLDDGRVLVTGGINPATDRSVPDAALYDPVANTWVAAASMAGRRYGHTATLLRDGRVLIVGGTRSAVVLDSVEIYDPRTNAWSTAASLSTPRSEPAATLLQDGRVLVAGGDGSVGILASAELYDPDANTWSSTQPMAAGRHVFSATLLKDGAVLVVGGFPHPEQVGGATAELFRPAIEAWSPAGSSTQPVVIGNGVATTVLGDGRVLICGGSSPTDLADRTASGFIYDPRLDRWTPTGDMARGRVNHSASLLPDGRVLVAGGRDAYSNGTSLNTTEIFEIPAASSPVVSPAATGPPTQQVGSRLLTAPLVAGGIVVIAVSALALITPPLVRRWRRRRGI